jgi:glycosyltransferase involved in cell wall biosynthesis
MKIGVIPSFTATGERQYGNYLIEGFKKNKLNMDVLNSVFFNKPNRKMYLGSLFINQLIEKDITHIHNLDNLGPFLFNFNHKKIKRILTIHDLAPLVLPGIHSFKIKYDFKFCLSRILKNSDMIISVSHTTKNDLIKYFKPDPNKIVVIPSGIDITVFRPEEPDKEVLRKYDLQQNYILYVGNDNIRKNLKNLLLGFLSITNKIPHDLVLVGPINPSSIYSLLKNNNKLELAKRIKILNFVGLEELVNIYNGADLFVFPSLYEGFGFPPLEALACGVPVIISNNSSLREMVSDHGIYLNNPLNSNEISEVILKTIKDQDLLQNLKDNGPSYVKKFQWENTVKRTIEAYCSI